MHLAETRPRASVTILVERRPTPPVPQAVCVDAGRPAAGTPIRIDVAASIGALPGPVAETSYGAALARVARTAGQELEYPRRQAARPPVHPERGVDGVARRGER